jgi:hypothetical protein
MQFSYLLYFLEFALSAWVQPKEPARNLMFASAADR